MSRVINILICGLSKSAVERIDAEAAALGLSRNEFLRRKIEQETQPSRGASITADDWDRSAAAFRDLADPSVMNAAWR